MIEYLTTIFVLLAVLPLLGTAAHWIAFRVLRVDVSRVTVFYGRPIARFPLAGAAVCVGYISVGSSIEYDIPVFRSKPLFLRLLLIFTGPVSLMLLASCILGFDQASGHFVSAFVQLAAGAFSPCSTGSDYITGLHNVFLVSKLDAAGIIASKLAGYSCLPFGGMATAEAVRQLSGPYADSEPMTRFVTFSAVASILLAALWAVALVSYAINNAP